MVANGLSPVDGVFQGQMENALQCQRCGYESVNYSTFYVLSLALPKPSAPAFYKSGRVKLEDCINMFTSDEVLTGENAWDCPKCGSKAVEPRFTSRTSTQTILPNSPHHHKKSKFLGYLQERPLVAQNHHSESWVYWKSMKASKKNWIRWREMK